MRVLIATHYWLPHPGGIEFSVGEQARRLAARGHSVTVVTSAIGDERPSFVDQGVTVHRVRAWNGLERRLGVPYPLFSPDVFGLMARLAGQNDVVYAHTHTFVSTVAAARAARLKHKPFVLYQHNPYIDYAFPLSAVQDAADALIGRHTIRAAQRVLVNSEFTAGYCRRLAPDKTPEVVLLGVDTIRFSPAAPASRECIRQRLGLPPEAFIAFTVRRLFYRNGVDVLVRAAALLKDRDDIHIIIGGKGPDRPRMEQYIADNGLRNVHLVGYVPDDALPDYFRAADVHVLPSRTAEGFGLVLLEAAACGVPSIATRSGGPEELIRDGADGLLVPVESPESIAKAIVSLRDAPGRAPAMGAAARAFAETLDWERCVDRVEEILQTA